MILIVCISWNNKSVWILAMHGANMKTLDLLDSVSLKRD